MQKLSDVKFPTKKDIPSLKKLWHTVFGDDYGYIDEFFSTAFSEENTLVICDGDTAVSALYLVESNIVKSDKTYNAYYVYAVATLPLYRGKGLMTSLLDEAARVAKERKISYLFLVPAEVTLYGMYGRLGYKKGFYCKEETVYRKSLHYNGSATDTDYESYQNIRREFPLDESVIFGEKGFDIFVSPKGEDMNVLCIENIGCCVYEKTDGGVVVWELFGDEDILLNNVFEICGIDKLRIRKSVSEGGSPCGMYKSFGDAPKLESAFIGAYGG